LWRGGRDRVRLGSDHRRPSKWGTRIEPPLLGPAHVIRYLSRYVHRIAISNSRIRGYDGHTVVFRYKDRKDGKVKHQTVSGEEFCRLFLQHVLPDRFVRIRHYGLFASRKRQDLNRARVLLGSRKVGGEKKRDSWVDAFQRIFGRDPLLCPRCKIGRLVVRDVLPPLRL